MKNKKIGFIGTGLMGLPMAKHLMNAGYTLNVYNRSQEKASELLNAGAEWCANPMELASKSDIIITIIGTPVDVEQCYFGEEGIFKGARSGAILIDMTTTKPSLAIRIANYAKPLGIDFIDAPVSGGEVGAINAALSIMIGGDEAVVAKVQPLFEIVGKNIVYQGAVGSGQHTKMCNQITIAGTLIGVCEALIYGKKAGLDMEKMLSSISKGAAGCWRLDVLAQKLIKSDYSPGFTVANFLKDLKIALEEAEQLKLSLPGLALAKQLYMTVVAMGKENLGNQALYLALEKLSNMELA